MPRPKNKKQYTDVQDRTVFLLKHPLSKEFYIGHTLTRNLRSTYKDHYIETKYKTANMIHELKKEGLKPCMFLLQTITCTPVQAYRLVIVWTRILLDNGYENLDRGAVVDYANDLLDENLTLYEKYKHTDIKTMTECKNCLFHEYGRKRCPLRKEPIELND